MPKKICGMYVSYCEGNIKTRLSDTYLYLPLFNLKIEMFTVNIIF